MTLLPLTPLDLPALSAIMRNGGEIACDWLHDQFAERHGIDPAGQQALGDVLLLYARDIGIVPAYLPPGKTSDDVFQESGCLVRAHFTEPLLARYLGMVGDGRAEQVGRYTVERERNGAKTWFVCLDGQSIAWKWDANEAMARLEMKRQVLGLFGELRRTVYFQPDTIDGRKTATQVWRPTDFLPPEYGDYPAYASH